MNPYLPPISDTFVPEPLREGKVPPGEIAHQYAGDVPYEVAFEGEYQIPTLCERMSGTELMSIPVWFGDDEDPVTCEDCLGWLHA